MRGLASRLHPSTRHQVAALGLGYGTHMALSMATGFLFMGAGEGGAQGPGGRGRRGLSVTAPTWPSGQVREGLGGGGGWGVSVLRELLLFRYFFIGGGNREQMWTAGLQACPLFC